MIVVRLEDEEGNELDAVGDATGLLARRAAAEEYRLLRYVDPYGDTVFNRRQAGDLLADLAVLRAAATGEDEAGFLDRFRDLAERVRDEVHLYLRLYGD